MEDLGRQAINRVNKSYRGQRGASIAQVLVLVMVMSVVALVFATIVTNVMKDRQRVGTKNDIQDALRALQANLAMQSTCSQIFRTACPGGPGLVFTGNPAVQFSVAVPQLCGLYQEGAGLIPLMRSNQQFGLHGITMGQISFTFFPTPGLPFNEVSGAVPTRGWRVRLDVPFMDNLNLGVANNRQYWVHLSTQVGTDRIVGCFLIGTVNNAGQKAADAQVVQSTYKCESMGMLSAGSPGQCTLPVGVPTDPVCNNPSNGVATCAVAAWYYAWRGVPLRLVRTCTLRCQYNP